MAIQNAIELIWNQNAAHLQYFDDYLLVVCDVDGFEHFAVLSSAEFPHQLVVILIPVDKTDSCYYKCKQNADPDKWKHHHCVPEEQFFTQFSANSPGSLTELKDTEFFIIKYVKLSN